ncbi:MAG: recombination mediator RecR [bacterium]
MTRYPEPIKALIEAFSQLPGVGQKTAERYVFYLLAQPKQSLEGLGQAVVHLRDKITTCSICSTFTETDPCDICSDSQRSKTEVCIVAQTPDLLAIEATSEFKGRYHVLGGVLNPIEGITPDQLNTKSLLDRITKDSVAEVLIATNPDMEGEATALYLYKLLKPTNVKITRLARGLPMGSNLEYADEATLGNAIKGRRDMNNGIAD